jgi:hypothetical protein
MKDFSLANLIRYVFPSFVLYVYFLLVNPSGTSEFTEQIKWIGIIAFIFVGCVMYFLYRTVFHRCAIPKLQDLFRRKSANFRIYAKAKYKIDSYQANLIWMRVRTKFLKDEYHAPMVESAAGAHLLYISGILGIFVCILGLFLKCLGFDYLWGYRLLAVLFIGLATSLSAFWWDKSYEDIEFRMFCSLEQDYVDAYIQALINQLNMHTDTATKGRKSARKSKNGICS